MENNHPTPYQELLNEDTKVHIPIEVFIEEIDKDTKIKNDPNSYSNDPKYIFELVQRVITLSMETQELLEKLPNFQLLGE